MAESTQGATAKVLGLNALHINRGAAMTVRNGWSLPRSYGEVAKEYTAVRTGGAGLIDLSSRGRIEVSGAEAVAFLNGMVTNDIKTLPENGWFSAAFPNVQGRLLAIARVLHIDKSFLFDTEEVTFFRVLETLSKFTFAGDFKVKDRGADLALLSVQGARAAEIVDYVLGAELSDLTRDQVLIVDWRGASISVIRATHTGEDGFDLFVPAESAGESWESLTAAGCVPIGQDALEMLRIEAGIPRHGVDMDETNVVLETGLDDAVSFTKGCYIGQEIIARIHWRGHVAKRLAGLIVDGGPAQAGGRLIAEGGKEVGRITSALSSPLLNKNVALALVKYDYLPFGTVLRVTSGDAELNATVADLPFIRGSWSPDDSPSGEVA